MEYRYDSVCGLFCGACDVLLANKANQLEEMAKLENMSVADLRCHGCKSVVNAVYCIDCDMRLCAIKKKIEYCFQCDDFPCARLQDFNNDRCPHHSVVLNNLNIMKNKGVEQWINQQKTRWSCTKCGCAFSYYMKNCSNCGTSLRNIIEDIKNKE